MKQNQYFIWGTGKVAQQIAKEYEEQLEGLNILGYIDNDMDRQGTIFEGKRVFAPNVLLENRMCFIIIASSYRKEIQSQIEKKYPWMKNKIMERQFFRRLKLISRYQGCEEQEILEIVDYLKNNPLQIFNYSFTEKYENMCFDIKYDVEKGLYYIYHDRKKMFFSRNLESKEKVSEYYRSICIEQDIKSPHRYLTDIFTVSNDAVVIDAGVAEGNFALSVIDKVKKIYLFEPDDNWVEALKYTFEPYKSKVVIINKGISNYLDYKTTTIDREVLESEVDFIKMDIEGEEFYALEGAQRVISSSKHMKCAICAYHQEFAYAILKDFLIKNQFCVEPTAGYMWYFNEMRPWILRHGLIRAEK